MKSLKLLFFVALVLSLHATHAAKLNDMKNNKEIATMSKVSEHLPSKNETEIKGFRPTSLRGTRSFLSNFQSLREGRMTCNKYPRVCRAKGSGGPDCCKKKCVNIETDRYNCGRCGKKCRYSQICCNGKCVNPMFNEKHCGGCNNRCSEGSSCFYGMCGYA